MMSKQDWKLIYKCVENEIDTYTQKDIVENPDQYTKLNILLSEIKKEIDKWN